MTNDRLSPRTEDVVQEISALWTSFFGEDVGRDGDFFLLGGESLMAVKTVAHLEEIYDLKVDVEIIFDLATIPAIADHVMAALRAR